MLTKIKESFLRAWRGEEDFKTVLKIWGGSGLIVGIANLLLFIFAALSYSEKLTLEFIMILGYVYIYLILVLVHKNIKLNNIFYKISMHLIFICIYIILLKPLFFNLMLIGII